MSRRVTTKSKELHQYSRPKKVQGSLDEHHNPYLSKAQPASCTRLINHQCYIAQETEFELKHVTPIHLKAQEQVEVFTEMVKKTISIALQDYIDPHEVTYKMVEAYGSNPHPATGMIPCRLLMNLDIRSKLDHFPAEIHSQDQLV